MRQCDVNNAGMQQQASVVTVQIMVEQVADTIYCHTALAASLSADVDRSGHGVLPLPSRAHRGVIYEWIMRETVAIVCDLGLAGSLLPIDDVEAQLEVRLQPGTAETFRRTLHDAAAYAVLRQMHAGINNAVADAHAAMYEGCMRRAKACMAVNMPGNARIAPRY